MQRAVSRRSFLGTAGAVVGGLTGWAARPHVLRAADDANLYGGFPLGLQSYTLRAFSRDTALKMIHEDLGLHFVELSTGHFPVDSNQEQIDKTKAETSAL